MKLSRPRPLLPQARRLLPTSVLHLMQNAVMESFMTMRNAAICLAAFCFAPTQSSAQNPAVVSPVTPPPIPFVTVGELPAVLYDGPSVKANKTFVLSRHQPLEVLVRLDKWSKVRETDGSVGWLENSALGDRRHVLVTAATAEIRAAPAVAALLVFEAQRRVVLEVSGPATDGWLPVRHRDGQSGFVRRMQIWGG